MASKKIASNTVIKEVSAKADGVHVKFGKFSFEPGQAEKLMDLAKGKEKVTVTIEVHQKYLPGTE